MIIVTILLAAACAVLALPVVSDVIALVRRVRPARNTSDTSVSRSRLLFLVPAHNEELLIADCIRSLLGQDCERDRYDIVVIADNCTDGTAAIVRGMGVTCLERKNTELRGKPRAIAWAIEQLADRDVDAIVITDADSSVDSAFARTMLAHGSIRNRVIQPYNGVSNPEDGALARMGEVFSAARFRYAFPLKNRAGLTVPLSNGMCIGRDVLERYPWDAFSLCEDWEQYARYTLRGVPIDVEPWAVIRSQEARSLSQSASQRKRWSSGRMTVMLDDLPKLLSSRTTGFHQKLDAAAELILPGPTVTAVMAVFLAILVLWLVRDPTAMFVLLLLLALSVGRIAFYAIAGILADAEPRRALLAFLYLPAYAVWRIIVQVGSLLPVGDRSWVRTGRHRPRATPSQ